MFAPYLSRWHLTPDGEAIYTHSSDLLPVQYAGQPAMLKLARTTEEQVGHRLMLWLDGDGAAQVYAHEGAALLMERLDTRPSLAALAVGGQDDAASAILCRAIARIHTPRASPAPEVTPLDGWFSSLAAASGRGGVLAEAWVTAQVLLVAPQDVRPLHGDVHHGNVLHSPQRGWLAIDPKGLLGERGYDYANIFCNPDMAWALRPGRLEQQARLVADLAGLEPVRLLRWILAYAGLSAAWWLEDGNETEAAPVLELASRVAGLLRESGLSPA